ncbi:F-type H+-transporting ATPase subunit b [Atopomonas hussainii]|uniref:ATP synthase subunit b n=1 Tax=Atopomonas hussainii TaxID=1429083 RepID=A0A1H7FNV0_9GAMM|nr:F0F1 ATP synthase subunit B [Atopomonas hussainii]SEK25810.1 F-type H+-transporting ATPase subunit b [Atopomonas hussainii]
MNINATLIGQSVAFFVFVLFCMKYVWPPVIQALQERQKKIADGLDAANRASRDLELAQEKVAAQLRDAKAQAAEIVEQAKKTANQIVEESRDQARAEGDRLKAQAKAEIEQELNQIKDALRAQLGGLVVAGAEKVLGASVDQNAHAELVNKLAAEL